MNVFYKDLIEHSYDEFIDMNSEYTKTDFVLALFDIYLYEDGEDADFFAEKLLEVINAISQGYTHEYHNDHPFYYFAVLHYTQIANKIEWGTSIRGAHWAGSIELNTCVLFDDKGNQLRKWKFSCKTFKNFTNELFNFYYNKEIT